MKYIRSLLFSSIFLIFFHSGAQVVAGKNENGFLQFEGLIESNNKENFDLSECISGSVALMGEHTKTISKNNATDSSFVKGEHSYSYYVNDLESSAGDISFSYSFTIRDGKIAYRFYNFDHTQSDSKFMAVGVLPLKWNEKVQQIFTEKQFDEIMTDIKLNVANAVRMVRKNCID